MFEKFYKFAGVENQDIINSPESFLKAFSGATFKNGLYRIHDEEIADYSEDSLASDFFEEWYESDDGCDIPHDKCVGYKVPLFLNGEDNISNLELSDMDVYWNIMGQMMP